MPYKMFLAYGGDWVESKKLFERIDDVIGAQNEVVRTALENGWNVGTRVESTEATETVVRPPVLTHFGKPREA